MRRPDDPGCIAGVRQPGLKWRPPHRRSRDTDVHQRSFFSSLLGRPDLPVLAQCMSWMAVAAVGRHRYEQAKDHATDAISLARKCHDRALEGFARVYLAHALRGLGQLEAAAHAYNDALQLLRKTPSRIGVVAFLGLADAILKDGDGPLVGSSGSTLFSLGHTRLPASTANHRFKPGCRPVTTPEQRKVLPTA